MSAEAANRGKPIRVTTYSGPTDPVAQIRVPCAVSPGLTFGEKNKRRAEGDSEWRLQRWRQRTSI